MLVPFWLTQLLRLGGEKQQVLCSGKLGNRMPNGFWRDLWMSVTLLPLGIIYKLFVPKVKRNGTVFRS
jgi:hypothetical protein